MAKKPLPSLLSSQKPQLTSEDWAAKSDEADHMFSPGTPIELREQYSGRRMQIKELVDAVKERAQA